MDEPIIYSHWESRLQFLKTPAKCMYDKLNNALMLDDKDEFLRLINDPGYELMRQNHRSQCLFHRELDANMILERDAPQIAMALLSGETRGIIDDPQTVFKDGWTPLHLASVTPSPKLIKCLIQRGDPVDVPCDYAPLNLKQATPLDLALQLIDSGYRNRRYLLNRPWTLRRSIFELFNYVFYMQEPCLEVIRLLVQNTQNKERVRKAFFDAANEGKLVTVVALFLAAPELFLSMSLEGGSMSSVDELYLNLKSLDKRTDIQDGLLLLLDVFDLIGHKLVAYVRLNDPKVWALGNLKKITFFLREAAHMKLGISSPDDYLLSLFKPVSHHAFEPPCIIPDKVGTQVHIGFKWQILHFPDDINIDYVNRMLPSFKPHVADYLREAIENKLSTMPNICTLFKGTTRMPNVEGKQRPYPRPRSIELPRAQSFHTESTNVKCRLDFTLIPINGWESRVMNSIKLKSFNSVVRLSHFPMIAKRLVK